MNRNASKKVLLGFSGGVDSSAAALILKERGYEVAPLYFNVLPETDSSQLKKAENAASALGLELLCTDISKEFEKLVIQPFLAQRRAGITPNPCVNCNPAVKFALFKRIADEIEAEFIATGHFARIADGPGGRRIYKARCADKDQSYILYRLNPDIISRLVLPIGDADSKEELRELLRNHGIPSSEEKESQDMCFVVGESSADFIAARGCCGKNGRFLLSDGSVVGEHGGVALYTVGQRKGLGLALGKPYYVKSLNAETGDILLAEDAQLYDSEAFVENLFWQGEAPAEGSRLMCKLRYTAKEAPCRVYKNEGGLIAEFDQPMRAITPGQSAVFYSGDLLEGGGYIYPRP